jgi:hypothetical protein
MDLVRAISLLRGYDETQRTDDTNEAVSELVAACRIAAKHLLDPGIRYGTASSIAHAHHSN